jgi:hypothetical protein
MNNYKVGHMKNKIVDEALFATVIFLWITIVGILIILLNDMLRTPP